jgi:ring-1,2-phenylacetyl-CoA epoxidase subunit PaaE
MEQKRGYQPVTITNIKQEAEGVKTFVLKAEEEIGYKAGQFLTFVFEDAHGEERRSYSLSGSPVANEPLQITLKRVENGKYSRPLIDILRTGDVLTTTGAAGQFILPQDIEYFKQVFFFAAGIGITPIYSLIKELLYRFPGIELVLIYSNSSISETVFYKELLELHKQFPQQLRIEFLISSSPNLSRARLSKWLMPQLIHTYTKAERREQLFYTCGPFAYMRMVTIALEELKYSKEQVKKENFDVSRPIAKREPPDKAAHEIRLSLGGEMKSFVAAYPATILAAASENGIILPYSCETGRCGSCVMQCTKGRVWMSYNEVLTDKEIHEGKILTCVSHPVGGPVELK